MTANGTLIVFGAAHHLAFVQQPNATRTAGQAFSPAPTVSVLDANGILVANSSASITLAIGNNPGGGTLSGVVTKNAVNGVAAFPGLSIDKVGTGYTLAASSGGLTPATSNAFNITAGAATQVRVETAADGSGIVVPAQNVNSGSSITVFSISRDANDNFVDNVAPPVGGWSLVNITGGVVAGDLSPNPGRKSAVFTGNAAGSAQIQAAVSGLASVPSGTITVPATTVNTTTTVTSSANPSTYGDNVTFTARVHPASGSTPPTGTLTFTIDAVAGAPLALAACVVPPVTDACASTSTSNLSHTGSPHSVSADYTPDTASFNSSSAVAISQTVDAKTLTVTGITANNKEYDGNTDAVIHTDTATLVGVVGTDDVTLDTAGASGAFTDKNVGNGKTVNINGMTLVGADAGNYQLGSPQATATANITRKTLTVTGITADDKEYNGNTDAVIHTGSAALDGVISPDAVTLDTTGASGAFTDKNVGNGKTVNINGMTLGGDDAGNYQLGSPQATATANITPKPITASDITVTTKVFDGTDTATLDFSGANLNGVISPDSVSINTASYSAHFNDANAGTSKAVTVTGLGLTGDDAGNYTLTQPSGLTGEIKPAVTSTGVTSSKNPSTLGESVTFTATVSNTQTSAIPTGSVQFQIDGSNFGLPVGLDGTGNATTSTSSLAAGTHTVEAYYVNSDGNFVNSNGSLPGGQKVNFGFAGLFDPYAPPPRGYKIKSAIPLKWQYTDINGVPVNSSTAQPQVIIQGPYACGGSPNPNDVIAVDDAGKSGYQYDSLTNTWQFNWKTTGLSQGCYAVAIRSNQTGQVNPPPPAGLTFFPIQLVK